MRRAKGEGRRTPTEGIDENASYRISYLICVLLLHASTAIWFGQWTNETDSCFDDSQHDGAAIALLLYHS
jgi:hypothetical protein